MNDDDTLSPEVLLIAWIVVVGAVCALIGYLFH